MADTSLPAVLDTGDHASRPAASAPGIGGIYSCSTHSLIYQTDGSSWSTWANFSSSGIPATIFDAAGDIIVASAADTAARLAIGNAGGQLSRINGAVAWDAGTAFPTAAANDRFYRTDRNLEYFYDGTRWLTTTLYFTRFAAAELLIPFADTGALRTVGRDLVLDEWGTYMVDFVATTFVATGDGSNFWTVDLDWETAAISATTIATFDTAADTAANMVRHRVAIDAVLDSTARDLRLTAQDTGAPGTLRVMAGYSYRLIG